MDTLFDPVAYINEPRWQAVRPGLERITDLLDRMGRPQDRLKFAHVAGTNGKGSICAYVASVLTRAGYRTGMFTSPYILTFEERIRVDGGNIALDDLRDVTLFVREHAEAMAAETGEHPTEFELMTAVAFEHFARCACDIVVAEVGLGGRLDSTNVIEHPEVCVIARLGLDHTDYLGDTIEQIAREKAGIVKPGAPVVTWPQEEAALAQIRDAVDACGGTLVLPDFSRLAIGGVTGGVRSFEYDGQAYRTRLLGSYQPYNAVIAVHAVRELRTAGWDISHDAEMCGIADTVWPGRFEVVSWREGEAPVVVDGGHNPQGARALADSLADVFAGKKVVFVMSVLADKDYRTMIRTVAPLARAFVCATPPNPRALSAQELADTVREMVNDGSVAVEVADGLPQAFERGREIACSDDVVCAFGSLYSISSLESAEL